MLFENMIMAFHAIKGNKMRSFLTMLGIIIGIGSVISIVSIGDTMRFMVSDLYKNVGVTLATVHIWPTDGSEMRQSDYFNLDEIDRIKEVFGDEISYIDSYASADADVVAGRKKAKFNFEGINANYTDVQKINILHGRNLSEADVKGRKNNIVIEEKGAKALFGKVNAVGETLRSTIYGATYDFNVVGVYRKEQSPLEAMVGGLNETQYAYLPNTLLTWPNDNIYFIRLYAKEGSNMEAFSRKFCAYLANKKNRKPEDIQFQSIISEMGDTDNAMGGLSAAVGGIAAISLLVGGIGIMNIMLVSVTERTREIGIRKALGAKTADVMIQFLTESAVLSAMGGMIGILLGAGIVMAGGALMGISVVVKPSVVITAVGFSALVGVFFGIYPASKAAQKDPIDALRFE
ncbi:ABC transporter permease [Clostridium sp. E02]|uniref:ABC transporter permease n=1 Tax=Clostridium sp. E02 TaxID=2487134 RepID=UPI000F51DFA9|nr:ABC transporter permease [Clostridium sp. E02]